MIAGIVLAAGSSSRLGRPKQLLPLRGEPLLRHTIRRILRSSLDEVVVVVGNHADDVSAAIADFPVRVVINHDASLGQSTSVIAGLTALSESEGRALPGSASPLLQHVEAAIFLLGDQPGVDPEVIDALIAAWRRSEASIVAPHYTDGLGNPILFDRRVFPELNALQGDVGARDLVRKHRAMGELLLVPIDQPAPPDVDTEEDYAALIASFPD